MAETTGYVGPLTTTFTPPASLKCDDIYVASNVNAGAWLEQGDPKDHPACYPSGYNRDINYYYSPGICPSGYTYNPTTGNSENQIQTAICCPSGFMPKQFSDLKNTDVPDICQGRVPTATLATLEYYQYGVNGGDGPITGLTTTALKLGEFIGAWGIIVQRQEGDPTWEGVGTDAQATFPEQQTSTTPGQSTTTTTTNTLSYTSTNSPGETETTPVTRQPSREGEGGAETTGQPSSSPSNSTGRSPKSPGTIAAICVGMLLGLVCIGVIIYTAYRIRRSKRKQRGRSGDGSSSSDSSMVSGWKGRPEGLNRTHEKGVDYDRTPELETPWKPVELN